jgi:co-chaperonin GroES (HSP10)
LGAQTTKLPFFSAPEQRGKESDMAKREKFDYTDDEASGVRIDPAGLPMPPGPWMPGPIPGPIGPRPPAHVIQPVGYHVLVRIDPIEEMTPGKIVIPEIARDKEKKIAIVGTLVRIGNQAWAEDGERWAKPGDRVIFAQYGGMLVPKALTENIDADYRLLHDKDVIAILRDRTEMESEGQDG